MAVSEQAPPCRSCKRLERRQQDASDSDVLLASLLEDEDSMRAQGCKLCALH